MTLQVLVIFPGGGLLIFVVHRGLLYGKEALRFKLEIRCLNFCRQSTGRIIIWATAVFKQHGALSATNLTKRSMRWTHTVQTWTHAPAEVIRGIQQVLALFLLEMAFTSTRHCPHHVFLYALDLLFIRPLSEIHCRFAIAVTIDIFFRLVEST